MRESEVFALRFLSLSSAASLAVLTAGILCTPGCGKKPENGMGVIETSGAATPAVISTPTLMSSDSGASSIDLASEDSGGVLLGGFYDPEEGLSGRWTRDKAFVVLGVPRVSGKRDAQYFIRVGGMNFRPDDHSIYLKIDGKTVGILKNPEHGAPFSLWSEAVSLAPGDMVKTSIEVSSTYRPADRGEDDDRTLGVMVSAIGVLPARSHSLISFASPSQYLRVPISGMYAPEPGLPGRWTRGEMSALLEIPNGETKGYQLVVRGINYRPDSFTVHVFVDGKHLTDLPSPPEDKPFTLVSSCRIERNDGLAEIKLITDPVYQPWKHGTKDRRELGTFLTVLELRKLAYPGCVDFTAADADLVVLNGVFPEEEGLEGIGRWIGPEAGLRLSIPSQKRVFNSLIIEGINYRIDNFLLSVAVGGEQVYSFHPAGGNFSLRTPIRKQFEPGNIVQVDIKVQPAFDSRESDGTHRILGVVLRKVCIE